MGGGEAMMLRSLNRFLRLIQKEAERRLQNKNHIKSARGDSFNLYLTVAWFVKGGGFEYVADIRFIWSNLSVRSEGRRRRMRGGCN